MWYILNSVTQPKYQPHKKQSFKKWYEVLPEDGAVRAEACSRDLVINIYLQLYNVHLVGLLII